MTKGEEIDEIEGRILVVKFPTRKLGQSELTTEDGRRRVFTRSPPNLREKEWIFVVPVVKTPLGNTGGVNLTGFFIAKRMKI